MEIEIREALERTDIVFIDVRSPQEYAEASIPGAVNIPLFDDRQHHQLGIIFHQCGEHEARSVALEMVAPNLPRLIKDITKVCNDKQPLLYCHRGGMRSLSLYQVLTLAGIPAFRLKKGYRAFRHYVHEQLSNYQLKSKLLVLHGLTGVGKTAIIEKLAQQGIPTIDLEGLARHRGSVFGAVGLDKPRSQKDFDALLLSELDRFNYSSYLFIEGEGRRIGNVFLPPFLFKAMKNGYHILVTAPLNIRVERIIKSYIPSPVPDTVIEQLSAAILSLQGRINQSKISFMLSLLQQRKFVMLAEILCTDYYDLYYQDSRPESTRFDAVVDAVDINSAVLKIIDIAKLSGKITEQKTKGVIAR